MPRMREQGLPKVLAWRWAPCAALVAGSLSFVGFACLVIPDHIGDGSHGTESSGLGLSNAFSRPSSPASNTSPNFSSEGTSSISTTQPGSPVSRVIAAGSDAFPKRGFSPPLERAEQPAPAPPPPQLQALPPPQPAPPAPPPPAQVAPTVAAIPPAPPTQADAPAPQAAAEAPPGVTPTPVGAEAN